jgi:Protein of unknown function (DUF2970)
MSESATTRASLLRSVRTVAWSFLGIRKSSEFQKDIAGVQPLHVIAVGLVGALLFVLALVLLVNWIAH